MVTLAACGGDGLILVAPPPGTDTQVTYGPVADSAGAKVRPLVRERSVDRPVTWSFLAGPTGVTSRNGATGLTIRVPQGALADTVTITVTALPGSALGYQFEPHGLRFAAPVEVTQSLVGLRRHELASGYDLVVGYFRADTLAVDGASGIARAAELLPVRGDARGLLVRFDIRHFSGYTVASAVHDQEPNDAASQGVLQ